jgi:hypothetical protein
LTVFFEPKILSQHVDTLCTSHKSLDENAFNGKFDNFCRLLEDYKEKAQELKDKTNSNSFVTAELMTFGRFKVFAQGSGVYRYQIANEDVHIKLGAVKFGADRPQILVKYFQGFLFTVGHQRAYEMTKAFIFSILGASADNVTEIHLATDIWGVRYDYHDTQRFMTHFKENEVAENPDLCKFQVTGRRNTETISFGKDSFMFRIYDKNKQLTPYPDKKALLLPKWIVNGYDKDSDKPVFRHEIQLRGDHLKKHIDPRSYDKVGQVFANLGKFWGYAVKKVQFVGLSQDEIDRVCGAKTTSAIKMIFHRAKQDEKRFQFWDYLQTWDNYYVSQTVEYSAYKFAKEKAAEKAAKMFISSAYKHVAAKPDALAQVLVTVSRDLYNYEGLTLHTYGQKKVVDSFMQNERAIVKFGFVPPDEHFFAFKEAQESYFQLCRDLPILVVTKLFSQNTHEKFKQATPLYREAMELF